MRTVKEYVKAECVGTTVRTTVRLLDHWLPPHATRLANAYSPTQPLQLVPLSLSCSLFSHDQLFISLSKSIATAVSISASPTVLPAPVLLPERCKQFIKNARCSSKANNGGTQRSRLCRNLHAVQTRQAGTLSTLHRRHNVSREESRQASCLSHRRKSYGIGDDKDDVNVDAVYKRVQPNEMPSKTRTSVTETLSLDIDSDTAVQHHESDQKTAATTKTWPQRFTIIALCFLAFMLCNMDRVNMSIAVLPMQQQYGWNSQTLGIVQSSFFWGYLLTQVVGGIAADRLGGKVVLGLGVVWWSLATVLTPVAAQMSLPVLLGMRALMGIGEGVAMPAMNNMLSRWVPAGERSRSLALVYSGMYTGSMLGLGVSPGLINSFGWPSVFYIFGGMGIVWWVFWTFRAHSTPAEDPNISKSELDFLNKNTAVSKGSVDKIPWKLLLSRKEVWAIILSHFCHNWGVFILLTWMPSYYASVLGFDLASAGLAAVYPWLCMAVMANVGGWIADSLVSSGVSRTVVRKVMQTLGFLGPAFFLTQLQHVSSPMMAILCMCACQGFDAFSQSGLYSNHQDIGPKYAGVLLGMSNTAGVLAGVISTAATGYILAVGSWNDVWNVAIFFYLLGTLIWNLLATGEQVFD